MSEPVDRQLNVAPSGRRAPGPMGWPLLGITPQMSRRGMIDYYVDVWRRFGDVVRLPMGPLTGHLVVWPDDVKRVLVDNESNYRKGIGYEKVRLALGEGLFTAEGDLWRRQRRLLQPPFTPSGVQQFAGVMVGAAAQTANGWQNAAREGEAVEINAAMMRLAMSIIARTMLSIDIGAQAVEAAQAFTLVLEYVSRRSVNVFDLPLGSATADNRRFRAALDTLDRFIYGVIEERRRRPRGEVDLLSMLLAALDPEAGEGMPLTQVRDEVLTIFFAGHETTAQALTWAWYLLAQHPAVEEQLHAELQSVLAGRLPTAADVPNLRYTRMVAEETMRLFPPVWVFVRQANGPDVLGGYDVPTDSMIILSQYVTHRHPQLWPEPERFDPERFSAARSVDRPRYAYFPFGGGSRVCLGSHFALLEATIVLATVAQQYRLRLVPGQSIRPRMVGTLRPNGPVMMTVESRVG